MGLIIDCQLITNVGFDAHGDQDAAIERFSNPCLYHSKILSVGNIIEFGVHGVFICDLHAAEPCGIHNTWFKTYQGFGDHMLPYEDLNAEASWDHCVAGQDCFQQLNGDIYKCLPLAYLPLQKEKYTLSSKWDHYLTYQPLSATSTEQEVMEFFDRKAESCCGMCPKSPQMFQKNSPLLPRKYYRIKKG